MEQGKKDQINEDRPPEFKLTNLIGGGVIQPGKVNKKGKLKMVSRQSVINLLVIVSNVTGQLWNIWEELDDEEKKANLGLAHNLLTKEMFQITDKIEGQKILNAPYPAVLFRRNEEGKLEQGYHPESVAEDVPKDESKTD